MTIPSVIACNVCHRQKGEANKWLVAWRIKRSNVDLITIPLDGHSKARGERLDLCGVGCLMDLLSKEVKPQ
jgi:hypothetical protein